MGAIRVLVIPFGCGERETCNDSIGHVGLIFKYLFLASTFPFTSLRAKELFGTYTYHI